MRRRDLAILLGAGALGLAALPAVLRRGPGEDAVPDVTQSRQARFDRTSLVSALSARGHRLGDAVHVRIYKREARLEVWLAGEEGRYRHFRDYPICAFSGSPGPKLKEGDRQAPEGFYKVRRAQLNPASRHHLAFNLGFPNEYDRQLGRTGSALMVHGGCSSVGCYAITDAGVDEVYAMVDAALAAGQDGVDVHAFPFVMDAVSVAALARDAHPWAGFWANLAEGHAIFESERRVPRVAACSGRYVFDRKGADCVPIAGWVA